MKICNAPVKPSPAGPLNTWFVDRFQSLNFYGVSAAVNGEAIFSYCYKYSDVWFQDRWILRVLQAAKLREWTGRWPSPPGPANGGRSVSGHVAPSLVRLPCQPSRHHPRTGCRSRKLCHWCNISSCTFRWGIRGLGESETVKQSSGYGVLLLIGLLIITDCFSIKMLKIFCYVIK